MSGGVVDYAALPGPGGRPSKLPAVDARVWTLKVALSQRPWSFVASLAMAGAFLCNGLTPVVVGRAVDDAIATSSLDRLGFWLAVLAGLYLLSVGVNWIARFMLVRSQQLVRTAGGLLLIASSDTARVGEIVMMTVMPVAEAASITYERSKENWFVLSGHDGDRIYYQRTAISSASSEASTLFIDIPTEQKPFYQDIIARMSWSFRPR